MRFYTYSEPGHNHENQDAVLARHHPADASCLICVLADGHGGQHGGKAAAQVAVQTVWEEAASKAVRQLCDKRIWCEIIAAADEAVEANEEAGFTTLIVLALIGGEVYGASVGDSKALLVMLQDHRVITGKQYKNPPVGSSAAWPVSFTDKMRDSDVLLLMSDGVWRYTDEDTISEIVRREREEKLAATLRELQTSQNRGVLPDDFSLIAVDIVNV